MNSGNHYFLLFKITISFSYSIIIKIKNKIFIVFQKSILKHPCHFWFVVFIHVNKSNFLKFYYELVNPNKI